MSDLARLSLAELMDLRARVTAQIELKRDQAKVKTRREIEAILIRDGFTIDEVFGSQAARQKKPISVMYQNPDNQFETWSGRGRQPSWVKSWISSGKTLEDLKIRKGDA